jgi:hypothetical protein
MVQNLNNNLITAPELADLRRRLRNLDSKVHGTDFCLHTDANLPRTASLFSSRCSRRGATTLLLLSLYVFLHRRMNRHITFCRSCESSPLGLP